MTLTEFVEKYKDKPVDFDGKFGAQCFTAGHRILMEDLSYKPIEDVCEGDRVVGFSGINTVIQTHKREAQCVKTRTRLCNFTGTADHPFLMKSGAFLPISSINEGEVPEIYIKRYTKESGLTDSELLFLGFWLGDGNLSIHHDNRNDEIKITSHVDKDAEFLSSLELTMSQRPHQDSDFAVVGRLSSRAHPLLADIIRECYDDKRNKILRREFTNREWMLIIEGLYNADGNDKNNSWVICNTSLELLFTIQAAAYKCGYSTVSIRKSSEAGTPTTIRGRDGKRLHITRKKTLYRLTLAYRNKKSGVDDFALSQEDAGIQTVYNLGVDGDNTYVCNNYYVHNCVDLVRQYFHDVWELPKQPEGVEGAQDFYYQRESRPIQRQFCVCHTHNGAYLPPRGSVVIFKSTGTNKFGHIAICLKATASVIEVFEQDGVANETALKEGRAQKGAYIANWKYDRLVGWLTKKES